MEVENKTGLVRRFLWSYVARRATSRQYSLMSFEQSDAEADGAAPGSSRVAGRAARQPIDGMAFVVHRRVRNLTTPSTTASCMATIRP